MRNSHRLDAATFALLILPPLFWAGNTVLGKAVVGPIGPLTLSFSRWALALLLALPFAAASLWRERALLRRRWRALARLGLLGIASYNSLQYVALQTSSPLNIALIGASAPVFIVLIGALCYRERLGAAAFWGSLLSLSGVVAVITRGEYAHLAQWRPASGDLVMLLAVILWGFYTWELRRRPLGLSAFDSLVAQMLWGVVFIAPFAAWERWGLGHGVPWDWNLALAVGYTALPASLLAYVCWGAAVARTGAQVPAYFSNTLPVFVALLSFAFLHERIAAFHLVGAALIFLGIHVSLRGRARLEAAG
jgi:drug/metabolite transporter (DMT)-like permease